MEQNGRSGPLIIPAEDNRILALAFRKLLSGVAVLMVVFGLAVAVFAVPPSGGKTSEKQSANAPMVELHPSASTPAQNVSEPLAWNSGLSSGQLNPAIWALNAEGDFSERVVDVITAKNGAAPDYSLRLRVATMDTRDDTVKFFGACTCQSFPLNDATIAADLDWNDQANGCYMSAGLVLAPESTAGNPLNGDNWLKVEYIGVPPGKNARIEISVNQGGRQRTLYNEGWPEKNRAGRAIGVQHLEIHTDRGTVAVRENGALLFQSRTRDLSFESGHLYLQMSSHSNYPPREVYFREIKLSSARDKR